MKYAKALLGLPLAFLAACQIIQDEKIDQSLVSSSSIINGKTSSSSSPIGNSDSALRQCYEQIGVSPLTNSSSSTILLKNQVDGSNSLPYSIYSPDTVILNLQVCGADGRTYANKCDAMYLGKTKVTAPGACTGSSSSGSSSSDLICTMEYAPICGELNGQRITYGNKCMFSKSGATYISSGECTKAVSSIYNSSSSNGLDQCAYQGIYPVCAMDASGSLKTFKNICYASQVNFKVVSNGECSQLSSSSISKISSSAITECTTEYAPVCGTIDPCGLSMTANGIACTMPARLETFGNACLAKKAGATSITNGVCGSPLGLSSSATLLK